MSLSKKKLFIKIILMSLVAAVIPFVGACQVEVNDNPEATTSPAIPDPIHEDYTDYTGENGKTITLAATNANGVNGYFNSVNHAQYIMENLNTKLVYNLTSSTDHTFNGVESLETLDGGVYIKNTMDSYVETTDGNFYYSSGTNGRVNLYDEGYYYYNVHVLDQCFAAVDTEENYEAKYQIDFANFSYCVMAEAPVVEDGIAKLKVLDPIDPSWTFNLPERPTASDYSGFLITLKTYNSTSSQIFYMSGSMTAFDADHFLNFSTVPDGEFHTYLVLFTGEDIDGSFKSIRIDVGAKKDEVCEIKDFSIVKIASDIPSVKLDRNYNVYSDKINESVRYLAYEKTNTIKSIGTITKIEKSTVAKFVVTDKNGDHYDTLDGVDMSSVVYAGFDIKDVGIFGYILEDDATSGTLTITEEDDFYVLNQNVPNDTGLKEGKSIYITRRVYTDESHDFTEFLKEAYEERNPLSEITVNNTSKKFKFVGYDIYTGAYIFKLTGSSSGFDYGYKNPLKEHAISFSIEGESTDRKIYVRGTTPDNDGTIECATVLDENNLLMPIKVEVCKNFANDGEELFYTNNDSLGYGLSIFPMVVEENKTNTLTLANLYEQWGNYRLKQVSSIRFHIAYYHLSLGVTETNCIVLYNASTRLPDHRGISTLYWADEMIDVTNANGKKTGATVCYGQQPQHTNEGAHEFLQYTDSDGNYSSYENCGSTVISSSGPTLADITLNYISFDGKVLESYRHVEMPSTDENRAYYEIDYEFLDNVTIDDVKNNLSLYKASASYLKFGYLNENNESVITDASYNGQKVYKLGSESPYFDYFKKADSDTSVKTSSDVYCNLSFLLADSDITIGGKEYTGGFVVVENNGAAQFTLDIDGSVTFKKGDHIKLLCILMPWGGEMSENDDNVRMVRINTLLNPIKLDVTSGSNVEDAIVPTAKSSDGKTCEFTISGGYDNVKDLPSYASSEYTSYPVSWERDYNITIRLTGFKDLTKPVILEQVDGEWTEYVYSSSLGYDGYTVEYNTDGTFSYTFVVTMSEGKPRTFKFEA